MPDNEPLIGMQIVALKNRIVGEFNESHWCELGLLTGHLDRIERHGRLFRSLHFGDDDYEGNVLQVLKEMVDKDPGNLAVITDFVEAKVPSDGDFISSTDSGQKRIVFAPSVFRIPTGGVDYSRVAVMMPFSSDVAPVYVAIQDACRENGLTCQRADDIWVDPMIIHDVFALIYSAFIVVCDFTGKNPNVFYEAGISHTLGRHVVPLTQNKDDIPFDLQHHRYVTYLNNNEGRKTLEQQLSKRLATLVAERKAVPE